MILQPWQKGASYVSGDFVEDPKTGDVYVVVCPDHPGAECDVVAGPNEPRDNAEQFARVLSEDLPDR